VPGHRDHQMERGFNQAELLGRGFARRAGVPYAPLLRRVRHGARQSGLDRAGADPLPQRPSRRSPWPQRLCMKVT